MKMISPLGRHIFALSAAILACVCVGPATPAAAVEDLPAYYEFFMKQGGQTAITAELERNERIVAGDWKPIAIQRPIEDFNLPDGFGNTVGLRDYIGKKNVVLTTFRTWW